MYILGISAYFHDSAAAIIKDGEILFAVQEERFTRIKNDSAFPINAINFCLKSANISLKEIKYITYYEKPFIKFERLMNSYFQTVPWGFQSFRKSMPIWLKEKLFTKDIIIKELSKLDRNIDIESKLLFSEHHLSHLASSYYPSGFEEATLVSIDAVGESTTTTIAHAIDNEIEILKEVHFPNSLGLLYSAFTYFLGFKVNEGEYKVMGLAPYGEAKYVDIILEKIIVLHEDGSFKLNTKYFNFITGLTMTNNKFEKLFNIQKRQPNEELTQEHMDLAASIQEVLNQCVERIVVHAKSLTNCENLCLSGGVALNCVTNSTIKIKNIFKNIWIQPAAGDAGSAIGSALAAYHIHEGKPLLEVKAGHQDHMKNSLLGPSFTNDEVLKEIEEQGLNYEKIENEDILINHLLDSIENGKVIGLHRGALEFGPRALGNRSIIADPRLKDIQQTLNLKIKFRESFRPFAPIILEEHLKDWYHIEGNSPYMLFTAQLKENKYQSSDTNRKGIQKLKHIDSSIPGVTHVDYSSRIQSVTKQSNRFIYKLLTGFFQRTGCPILINTSFNTNGEPIVCHPKDSIKCFLRTDMDILYIEDYIIRKKENA